MKKRKYSEKPFLSSLKRMPRLDLLPFNELASSKYKTIGLDLKYQYSVTKKQSKQALNKLVKIAKSYGLEVTAEGLW